MWHLHLTDPTTIGISISISIGASAIVFALTALMAFSVTVRLPAEDALSQAVQPAHPHVAAGLAVQWRRLDKRIGDGISRSRAVAALHDEALLQLDSAAFALDQMRAEFSDLLPVEAPEPIAKPKPRPKAKRKTGRPRRAATRRSQRGRTARRRTSDSRCAAVAA